MACIVWPMPPIYWTQSGQWTLRPLHSIHHPELNADVHQHVPKRNMRQHHHQPSFQIKQVDLLLRVRTFTYCINVHNVALILRCIYLQM